ncbi:membrane protein insertase YidC [Candidatus Omnitrophota bacterium]
MDSEKRLFLAIALSILVLVGFQTYMRKTYKPSIVKQGSGDTVGDTVVAHDNNVLTQNYTTGFTQNAPSDLNTVTAPAKKQTPENLVEIETDLLSVALTDKDASIKSLRLLKFSGKDKSPTELVPDNAETPTFLTLRDTLNDNQGVTWKLKQYTDNVVTYSTTYDDMVVDKTFFLHDDSYVVNLEVSITNTSVAAQQAQFYLIGGAAEASKGHLDRRYIGADCQIGEKVYRRKPSSKEIQGGEVFGGSPLWVSTRGRYFSSVLKPEQSESKAFIAGSNKKNIWAGIMLSPISIESQQTIVRRYTLYAGPNDQQAIASLGLPSKNIISYGALSGIVSVIYKVLKFYYKISGNYGVAILLVSLSISVLLSPLTRKSLRSMKEMQKVQPEVEKIRKEMADNPQKMHKEIMGLYKEHKVNPVGGCFPMLLQFPVFISLYQVMIRSVELKGAQFLWIKDLTEPDAAFKLPVTIPILGNYLHILPILMAAAMFFQQKLSQPKGAEISEQQRMMSTMMPIMMCFIFYNLPSGLVMYWLTNTVTMLILQEVILKARPQK